MPSGEAHEYLRSSSPVKHAADTEYILDVVFSVFLLLDQKEVIRK